MREICAITLLSVVSGVHAFDTVGFCRQVSNAGGGSYQIEGMCRQQERQAQVALSRQQIPSRIEKYCQDVAQAGGGSYYIMLSCVRQELEAKARM
jgi:hypothetical protein